MKVILLLPSKKEVEKIEKIKSKDLDICPYSKYISDKTHSKLLNYTDNICFLNFKDFYHFKCNDNLSKSIVEYLSKNKHYTNIYYPLNNDYNNQPSSIPNQNTVYYYYPLIPLCFNSYFYQKFIPNTKEIQELVKNTQKPSKNLVKFVEDTYPYDTNSVYSKYWNTMLEFTNITQERVAKKDRLQTHLSTLPSFIIKSYNKNNKYFIAQGIVNKHKVSLWCILEKVFNSAEGSNYGQLDKITTVNKLIFQEESEEHKEQNQNDNKSNKNQDNKQNVTNNLQQNSLKIQNSQSSNSSNSKVNSSSNSTKSKVTSSISKSTPSISSENSNSGKSLNKIITQELYRKIKAIITRYNLNNISFTIEFKISNIQENNISNPILKIEQFLPFFSMSYNHIILMKTGYSFYDCLLLLHNNKNVYKYLKNIDPQYNKKNRVADTPKYFKCSHLIIRTKKTGTAGNLTDLEIIKDMLSKLTISNLKSLSSDNSENLEILENFTFNGKDFEVSLLQSQNTKIDENTPLISIDCGIQIEPIKNIAEKKSVAELENEANIVLEKLEQTIYLEVDKIHCLISTLTE